MITLCGLLTSANKQKYTERDTVIEKTWAPSFDAYYFLTSSDGPNSHYLKCSSKDDADSVCDKLKGGILFAATLPFDWFYIGCEDVYAHANRIKNFLRQQDTDLPQVFGFIQNSWEPDKVLFYPSGGAGTLISGVNLLLLGELIGRDNGIKTEGLGDVWLGKCYKQLGLELIHNSSFNPGRSADLNSFFTMHSLSKEDILKIHAELEATGGL